MDVLRAALVHHPRLVVRQAFSVGESAARPGWETIPAVRNGDLYEIKSPIILQPGPAALFDGLDEIHRIIVEWARH